MHCCKNCGPLPYSEFYTHPQMSSGYLNYCKTCVRARIAMFRSANLEQVRAKDRERSSLPHRRKHNREFSRKYRADGRGVVSSRKWIERNQEKRRAQVAAGNALRDGRLDRHPCEVCGAKAEMHHEDYSKPLEVKWRCRQHHAEVHRTYER